jgi:hypothetical protein
MDDLRPLLEMAKKQTIINQELELSHLQMKHTCALPTANWKSIGAMHHAGGNRVGFGATMSYYVEIISKKDEKRKR